MSTPKPALAILRQFWRTDHDMRICRCGYCDSVKRIIEAAGRWAARTDWVGRLPEIPVMRRTPPHARLDD